MSGSPLAAYLDARNETSEAFAARVGVGQPAVWRWRNGKRTPSTHWALRIAEVTEGAVPVTAWATKPSRKRTARGSAAPVKAPVGLTDRPRDLVRGNRRRSSRKASHRHG